MKENASKNKRVTKDTQLPLVFEASVSVVGLREVSQTHTPDTPMLPPEDKPLKVGTDAKRERARDYILNGSG